MATALNILEGGAKMGLDMYLYAYPKIGNMSFEETVLLDNRLRDWCGDKGLSEEERALIAPYIKKEGIYLMYETIATEVGYWRKANQVHKWFVENVQGGVDDCNAYEVTKENLIELFKTCQTVLVNREMAPDLLPTTTGFLFGSTGYDRDYFMDLIETIRIIRAALDLTKKKDVYFCYRSSW